MAALDPLQLAVARMLFSLPEAEGFALAGGAALVAMGAIDRSTKDIDAFVGAIPGDPPGDVGPLVAALQERLDADGWTVHLRRSIVTFARIRAVRPEGWVEIDLAVDSPRLFPAETLDGLPVLAGQDLAARKVLAILDRSVGRDLIDLHALAERYGRSACLGWAQLLDSGVRAVDVIDALGRLRRLDDAEVPCAPDCLLELRAWCDDWADELAASEA